MILAWDNKIDGGSVSTDSALATLPVANVQNKHLAQKWGTQSGVKSAYVLVDLGSSLSCSVLAFLGTNLTSAATLRIRCSITDATATGSLEYDSGTVAAGVKSGYGAAYKSFTAVAARYWRIDIADTTVADNLQIGRVFLGPSWTPSINMQLGASLHTEDPSLKTKSYGGQSHFDELPQVRVLSFTLDYLTKADMYGNAFAMARANGRVRDVLAIPDISDTYLSEEAVFGPCEYSEIVNDKLGLFRQKYRIEERL